MTALIPASLLLNIAVLIPVCWGIWTAADWAEAAYGPASDARGILLAVYLAILALSALLLVVFLVVGDPRLVAALLMVQVLYKLLTPVTVGHWGHPVVSANLAIAGVHMVTLVTIWLSWVR